MIPEPGVAAEDPGRPRLRVGIIASAHPTNGPLLRTLDRTCDVAFVLTVVAPPATSRLPALLSAGLASVVPTARALALRLIERGAVARTSRLLGGRISPFAEVERVTPSYVTGGDLAARLATEPPDVLFLSGAPVLPEEVFTAPRLATVNVHWGLARRYRGVDTLFLPLYRGEYDAVGVTLHVVDRGIDTGGVLREGLVAAGPEDTPAAVYARAGELVAELAGDLVCAIRRQGLPETGPAGRGVLVRRRDRRAWHHAHFALQRWTGRRPARG